MKQRDKNTDDFMEWFIDPKTAASKSLIMGAISVLGTIALIALAVYGL